MKIHFETSNEVVGGTHLQPLHCGSAKAPTEPISNPKRKPLKNLAFTAKEPLDEAMNYGGTEQSQDETTLKTAIDKGTNTGAAAVKNTATAPARLGNLRSEKKYNKLHKAEDKVFRHEQTTAYRKSPLSHEKPPSNPVSRSLQKDNL